MFRSEAVPRNECQVDKALNECEIPPVAAQKIDYCQGTVKLQFKTMGSQAHHIHYFEVTR